MTDPHIAKLTMRCSRRGIKEMDVILGGFAKSELTALAPEELTVLEALLEENDHDILAWIMGRMETPAAYGPLLTKVKARHGL